MLAFPQKRSRLCKDIASKQAGMLFNNTSCTNKKLFHLTIFFTDDFQRVVMTNKTFSIHYICKVETIYNILTKCSEINSR